MSNVLTDIEIPRPSPDAGKTFRLTDYLSDLLKLGWWSLDQNNL